MSSKPGGAESGDSKSNNKKGRGRVGRRRRRMMGESCGSGWTSSRPMSLGRSTHRAAEALLRKNSEVPDSSDTSLRRSSPPRPSLLTPNSTSPHVSSSYPWDFQLSRSTRRVPPPFDLPSHLPTAPSDPEVPCPSDASHCHHATFSELLSSVMRFASVMWRPWACKYGRSNAPNMAIYPR